MRGFQAPARAAHLIFDVFDVHGGETSLARGVRTREHGFAVTRSRRYRTLEKGPVCNPII